MTKKPDAELEAKDARIRQLEVDNARLRRDAEPHWPTGGYLGGFYVEFDFGPGPIRWL